MKTDKVGNFPVMEMGHNVVFSDLINIDKLQLLQDLFSNATGISSVIFAPDGSLITQPSNPQRFCTEIVRNTEKGKADCKKCLEELSVKSISGPALVECMCPGLKDAFSSSLYMTGNDHEN